MWIADPHPKRQRGVILWFRTHHRSLKAQRSADVHCWCNHNEPRTRLRNQRAATRAKAAREANTPKKNSTRAGPQNRTKSTSSTATPRRQRVGEAICPQAFCQCGYLVSLVASSARHSPLNCHQIDTGDIANTRDSRRCAVATKDIREAPRRAELGLLPKTEAMLSNGKAPQLVVHVDC